MLAFEAFGDKLAAHKDSLVDEDDPLKKTISSLVNNIKCVFGFVNTYGFFPLPYLWQKPSKPFDLLDMASLTCEICTILLTNNHPKIDNTLREAAKLALKKSLKCMKDSARSSNSGQYTWKGWGNINKPRNAILSTVTASTYFTSLCCSALTKYISTWDDNKDILNMGFERSDLVKLIIGGLKWVSIRGVETKNSRYVLYKYGIDNEFTLYWSVFFLIAVCDARALIEASSHTEIFEVSDKLWKSLIDETASNINGNSALLESITMQIDTPDTPAFYEDCNCLGSLTLALLKYSREFDSQYDAKDFVINYLSSKLMDELITVPDVIMSNHYNLRAYFELLKYKQSAQLSVPYATMKKLINDIIDDKVGEMKGFIFSKLRSFQKGE